MIEAALYLNPDKARSSSSHDLAHGQQQPFRPIAYNFTLAFFLKHVIASESECEA